MKGIKSG